MAKKNLSSVADDRLNSSKQINENTDASTKVPVEVKKDSRFNESIEDIAVDKVVEDVAEENTSTYKTINISATSKISCELNDVWYSFSFSEIRQILKDDNMEKQRQDLWDTVNMEVDKQVQDVIYMLKNPGAAV